MTINKNLAQVGLTERSSLIVYLKDVRDQYKLRRFGDIVYFSKKLKYCVLYLDQKKIKAIKKEISALPFVRRVENSRKGKIDFDSSHLEAQIDYLAKKAEQKVAKQEKENKDLMK